MSRHADASLTPVRLLGQLCCYALFAVFIVYFSAAPAYRPLVEGAAQLKLSLNHAGQRITECRRLSPDEIAKLAENMRQVLDCPRERVPVRVELDVDGKPLYAAEHPPSGLFGDGSSNVYRRFRIEPGVHSIHARLRDNRLREGFDHEHEQTLRVEPGQNVVVEFSASTGGFRIR